MAKKKIKSDPDKAIINHDISFQIIIEIALFDSHSQMKLRQYANQIPKVITIKINCKACYAIKSRRMSKE